MFIRKKGLSSLVGEAIMIGLVFTVAIFVYLWTGTFSNKNIDKTDERFYNLKECTSVKGKVEEVLYDLSSQTAKILLSVSPGGKAYVIERIELYNSNGELCILEDNILLKEGGAKFIEVSCSSNFLSSCNDLKSLAVISPCSDKSIFLADPLVNAVDDKCKLKDLLFY